MCECKDGVCKGHWCGCTASMIMKVLLVVGGLNWGLYGVGMLLGRMESWNVVSMLLGSMPVVESVVYVLVGVAAVMYVFGCKCAKCGGGLCNHCTSGGSMSAGLDEVKGSM